MEHRRLMILFAILSLFALGVIVWYFIFSTPTPAPTLGGTANPLSLRDLPARIGLIFQGNPPESTTETEVTDPTKEAFLLVWDNPATGNTFITKQVLRESTATTTGGTSTVMSTRTVRATTTTLLFVDRITGYVYGHDMDSGRTYQISNTTLPGIYDAYIWANGTKILLRYLDTDRKSIVSMMATIPNVQDGSDPRALTGTTMLPKNISSVAVSASSNLISYLVPNETGSSIYTSTASNSSLAASLPFSELMLSYGGEQLYATNKPSAYVEGSTISIPQLSRITGKKTGLVTQPHTNGLSINSMWSRTGLTLFGNNKGNIVPLPLQTIASKCLPADNSFFVCAIPKSIPSLYEGLPDDWYQGTVSFDDTLVVLNAVSGESYSFYVFDDKYGEMDVTHLSTSPRTEMVSFIRKQDGKLFLLNTALLADQSNE